MNHSHTLTLYHYWRSSSSWRVRLALTYKNIPCDYISVNLLKDEQKSKEHLKRNPTGHVPVLEIDGKFLGESTAILEWLDENFKNKPLLPKDPWDRALVRQLAQMINAGIQPVQNLKVMKLFSEDEKKRKEWSKHWIEEGFLAYETLASQTAGKFSFGDDFSMADCCLIPQVYNAQRFSVDLASFPTIQKINGNVSQTKAYKDSHPDIFFFAKIE